MKHYLCFGRYLTGVLAEIRSSYYFANFWFSTAIHDPAYLDSPSTLPSCFLKTLSAWPRFKLGIMLFPLQRDCDDATLTLTMTVTIQARDQDVPNKIVLPVTEDIPAKTNWPPTIIPRFSPRTELATNTRLNDTAACWDYRTIPASSTTVQHKCGVTHNTCWPYLHKCCAV